MESTYKCLFCGKQNILKDIKDLYDKLNSDNVILLSEFKKLKKEKKELDLQDEGIKNMNTKLIIKCESLKKDSEELKRLTAEYDHTMILIKDSDEKLSNTLNEYESLIKKYSDQEKKFAELKLICYNF